VLLVYQYPNALAVSSSLAWPLLPALFARAHLHLYTFTSSPPPQCPRYHLTVCSWCVLCFKQVCTSHRSLFWPNYGQSESSKSSSANQNAGNGSMHAYINNRFAQMLEILNTRPQHQLLVNRAVSPGAARHGLPHAVAEVIGL